jgi:glutaredoxin
VFFSHNIAAGAQGERESAMGAGTSGQGLVLYGNRDCSDCRRFKEDLFPLLQERFPRAGLELAFVDIDTGANFERYLRLEAAAGTKRHSVPVLHVGDRLFSGDQLRLDTIAAAIEAAGLAASAVEDDIGTVAMLAIAPIATVLAAILAAMLMRRRRSR